MNIKKQQIGENAAILRMVGKFIIEDVSHFEKLFEEISLNKKTKWIAIDFSTIDFIDSSAIGSLIKALNIAKNSHIEFFLLDLKPSIQNIFKLAYLDHFFAIISSEDFKNKIS